MSLGIFHLWCMMKLKYYASMLYKVACTLFSDCSVGNWEAHCICHKKLPQVLFYRKLNFTGCYTTSISHIKCYLKPKICYENVKEFDITSCYWLKSVGIRECVLKLSKLEALYAADTSLTRGDLMKILNSSLQVFVVTTCYGSIKIITLVVCYQHQYRLSRFKNNLFL